MIIVSLNRRANASNSGWEYQDFQSMEDFIDWLLDAPEKQAGVGSVWEFSAGKPWEVKNWEAQVADARRSAEDDRRHQVRWMQPGPL